MYSFIIYLFIHLPFTYLVIYDIYYTFIDLFIYYLFMIHYSFLYLYNQNNKWVSK